MIRAINNLKTAILMGSMMGIFLLVGAQYGQRGMMFALAFGGVMNVVAWFFSDRIAIAAMQGREVTATTGGKLYEIVDDLRRRAGLPMPRVYVCPHEAPNAFATGRSPSRAAVAVTQGALRLLDDQEMRGVIAHELAHIKNRDTLISCIAATIAGVLAYIAQWGLLFGGGNGRGGNPFVSLVTFIIAAVGAAVIKAMISRSREYVADADGARIAGTPAGLVSALQKLDLYSRRIPLVQPNPAQNSLFIVEPFAGGSLVNLFASHPPTEKRVAALLYGT
ncbi:MAG: M48 family metalloprotease [Phycisphaeraceae bacterium]|nr:M48 family metalloprotease [Phycisphaerae bacterium]MBX3392954.1 M48 family metalloprotease [Phycisphaeraceae bacterium]HRJ49187.1 M48 family metalloprotease [Phycisphaerales bacterium]